MDGKVRIRSVDGNYYRVAFDRLSRRDQLFVEAQLIRLAVR